jgi:folate-dependent phosphoribosylglycinamide formyltransferase PurN
VTGESASDDRRCDVVVLTAGGGLANIFVNKLAARFPGLVVIQEQGEDVATIFRRRAKLRGWWDAMGQHLFTYYGLRIVTRLGKARVNEICQEHGLERDLRAGIDVRIVPSINAPEALALLRSLAPKAVAVYGTRLLKRETLAAIDAPFINYHAGLNPKYRGQSGAYWALRSGDTEHAGLTIHLVDTGVDTGGALYQARSAFTARDNFQTYHFAQMAQATPLMIQALEDAIGGRLKPFKPELHSQQFFMPTLWGYVWAGMTKGVW